MFFHLYAVYRIVNAERANSGFQGLKSGKEFRVSA